MPTIPTPASSSARLAGSATADGAIATPPRRSPQAAVSSTSNDVLAAVEPAPIVIETSSFGSAPWSCMPSLLTVDVVANSVNEPSAFTSPLRLRRPSVLTIHGRPSLQAAWSSKPFWNTAVSLHLPPANVYSSRPAFEVSLPAVPGAWPSPSSATNSVVALANHRPNECVGVAKRVEAPGPNARPSLREQGVRAASRSAR